MKDSPFFVQFPMENVFHMNKEITSQYIVQRFILHSRISYTYISVISFMRTPSLFYEGFSILCPNLYREYVSFKYCNNVIVLSSGPIYLYVYHIRIHIAQYSIPQHQNICKRLSCALGIIHTCIQICSFMLYPTFHGILVPCIYTWPCSLRYGPTSHDPCLSTTYVTESPMIVL